MLRTYFSEEVKRTAVDLVLQSRLPVGVAAGQIGCSVNALHHWLKKHRHQQADTEPPPFVPITFVDPTPTSVEIITPNGFTVRLHSPIALRELFAAITSC